MFLLFRPLFLGPVLLFLAHLTPSFLRGTYPSRPQSLFLPLVGVNNAPALLPEELRAWEALIETRVPMIGQGPQIRSDF